MARAGLEPADLPRRMVRFRTIQVLFRTATNVETPRWPVTPKGESMARYFLDRRIHIGSTSAPGGFCFPDFGEDRPEPLRALCTIVVDAVLDDQAPGARAISIV